MNSQHRGPHPRYAVLHHETDAAPRGPHFDLLLEDRDGATVPAGMLIAYSIDLWPPTAGTIAIQLPAHRAIYLDYEGPVSRNRGSVRRVDAGLWQSVSHREDGFRARLRSETGADYTIALRRLAGGDQKFLVEERVTETVRKTGPLG